jgi:branched-chain amino acid transport system ATP-binding protein
MAILEVQDIHTYYGDAYVLQGLSLKLEQGQILGCSAATASAKRRWSIPSSASRRRAAARSCSRAKKFTNNSSFETVRSGMGLVPQGRRVFPNAQR